MRLYKDRANRCEVQLYQSLAELLAGGREWYDERMAAADRIGDQSYWVEGPKSVLKSGYMQSWADLERAAGDPWVDGIRAVNEMARDLGVNKLPLPPSRRRLPTYNSENGDEVDYDRLRAGQDYWRLCRREDSRGPTTVTILCDVTTSAYHSTRDIHWRGVAAMALAVVLERQGYQCELWSYQHCKNAYTDGSSVFSAVKLKDVAKPLNLNALVCGVAGWFYRTAMFCSYFSTEFATPTSGLGLPQHALFDWQLRLLTPEPNPIVITKCFSKESALAVGRAWVTKLFYPDKFARDKAQFQHLTEFTRAFDWGNGGKGRREFYGNN